MQPTMTNNCFRMYAIRSGQRSPAVVLELHTRESPSRFLILPKDDSMYSQSVDLVAHLVLSLNFSLDLDLVPHPSQG